MNYKFVALSFAAVSVVVICAIFAVLALNKDDSLSSTSEKNDQIAQAATTLPIAVDTDSPSATTAENPTSAPKVEAKPTPTGSFKVIGKDIVDPEGNIFIPMGANVGGPLADADGNLVGFLRHQGHDITTTESLEAVKAWKWNTLRLNSQCLGGGSSGDHPNGWGTEELFKAIDPVVDMYTSEKIVVMIDCHALIAENPEVGSPEYQKVTAFWKEAAKRYSDNPYVWFNHLNEFSTSKVDTAYWQGVVDDGYKTFAESGAQNIVLFDLPIQGQQLSVLTDPSVVSWAKNKCNVVWDWHSYGGLSTDQVYTEPVITAKADSLLASVSGDGLALVVGEFGHDWDANRKHSNWRYDAEYGGARAAMSLAPKYGYGLLPWHANGDNYNTMPYGLKNSDDLTFEEPTPGAELSDWGQLFWDESQRASEQPVKAGPTEAGCSR